MSEINEDKVGKYYLGPNGGVWELISYCDSPTATMRNVETGIDCGGAIGSPNLTGFELLKNVKKEKLLEMIEYLSIELKARKK